MKRVSKSKILGVVFIALVLVLVGISLPTACAKPKVFEWKYYTTEIGDYHELMVEFADRIAEVTDGQVLVTAYPVGELPYKLPDCLRVVDEGLVEMVHIPGVFIAGDVPEAVLPDLPFLARTTEEQEVYHNIVAPYMKDVYEKWNVKMIALTYYGRRQVITSEPVSSLADLKGKKIRVSGGLQPEWVKALGATPVTVPWGEVYTAFSRGVVDGVITASLAMEKAKLDEPGNYFIRMDADVNHCADFVNKDAWDALPEDLQNKILEVAKEFEAKYNRLILVDWEEGAVDRMVARGGLKGVAEISQEEWLELQEKTLPILEKFISERAGPEGLAVFEEVLRALGIR